MAIFLAWGLPRAGKGLIGSLMAEQYFSKGRRIVANYPLDLSVLATRSSHKLFNWQCTVVPACPSSEQLFGLGQGSARLGENGLIILDEAANFLGSREWGEKGRRNMLNFFRLHGKLRWDILMIVQDPDFLDKQVLKLVAQVGRVVNWGDLPIPVFGSVLGLNFPKFHTCNFKLGRDSRSPSVHTHMFSGKRFYPTYDTEMIFSDDEQFAPYIFTGQARSQPKISSSDHIPKHPLVARIMKLPEHRRMEFFRRFEATGAFTRYNPQCA